MVITQSSQKKLGKCGVFLYVDFDGLYHYPPLKGKFLVRRYPGAFYLLLGLRALAFLLLFELPCLDARAVLQGL